VAAALSSEDEHRGYESQGLPAHGRRYLFGESRIAQGCDRHFR
jgi:Peptidase S46